ncbi:MAG: LLM class flavin-dependent oxidoreductase [Actinomycetota bacterium]|nr:LLM class flavin-dependent oxidoreductase [Actinomycetota bacterium]
MSATNGTVQASDRGGRGGRRPVFEAEITPGMSAGDVVALAVLAERVGFDRLGISDVVLWPDCYVLEALCASATSRIAIGSMVTNPYTRHPAVHAGALATLADVSGGRAFCGIGVGAGLEPLGIDYPRPVRTLRESLIVMRGLLRGEEVTFEGETTSLSASKLVEPPDHPVPIAIGTRSPAVMRLAGELADIALVGARHIDRAMADQYRAWLAEGAARVDRDPSEVQVLPRVTLCVSSDGAAARSSVKRYAAHYLPLVGDRGPEVAPERRAAIAEALERATGWYFDHDRYDPPELDELIDDDLATAFAVAGTPAECAEQLRAVLDLGFDGVSCNLAAVRRPDNTMADGLRETLEGAAEILPALHPTP